MEQMNVSKNSTGVYSVVDLNFSYMMSTMTSSNGTNCMSFTSPMYDDIQFIDKILTPIIYVVGFPGNILSFFIWIQPRMRHSSGVYLAALALVDFIVLALHLLYELEKIWGVQITIMPVMCESFSVIFLTFQYLAPLLVLAFTVERYISICHPFKRAKYCTIRRAKMVSLSLATISLAICAMQGYFWTYKDGECSVRDEALIGDKNSLWNIYSWSTELLVFLAVPLSVLTFNILVIREAKNVPKYGQTHLRRHTQKTSATTIMLLAVSFYLIFTTLPVTVVYMIVLNFEKGPACGIEDENSTWKKYYMYHLVRAVIEEIGITHFALNFYIYVITGKTFRKQLKEMFIGMVCKTVPRK